MPKTTGLPIPRAITTHAAYEPVVRLLADQLITSKQLSDRWGLTISHLSNLRRAEHALPFLRLPTGPKGKGAIRYRLSGVIAAEIAGTSGATNAERISLAVAAVQWFSLEQRVLLHDHPSAALSPKQKFGADADAGRANPSAATATRHHDRAAAPRHRLSR
jgi:hypothetical protein